MVFAVRCPNPACRKYMLVEPGDRGKTVPCLICKQPIKVPPPVAAPVLAAIPVTAAVPPPPPDPAPAFLPPPPPPAPPPTEIQFIPDPD